MSDPMRVLAWLLEREAWSIIRAEPGPGTFDEVWSLMLAIAERDGVSCIVGIPGCWEKHVGPVDEHGDSVWWMAVNGHKEAIACSTGAIVAARSWYVTFNGWPAGVFDLAGGVFACGAAANLPAFCAAMRAELAK